MNAEMMCFGDGDGGWAKACATMCVQYGTDGVLCPPPLYSTPKGDGGESHFVLCFVLCAKPPAPAPKSIVFIIGVHTCLKPPKGVPGQATTMGVLAVTVVLSWGGAMCVGVLPSCQWQAAGDLI